MAENFGLKIGLEGEKEFKKALADINQSFKVLGSEMKLVSSEFDKNDKSVEALTARNTVLNKEISAQKEKIETLRSALKNAAESFGENDRRTQAWQIQLNNAEAALNGMERELKDNNEALDKAENGFDDAGKAADDMGDELDEAGKDADDASGKMEGLGKVCKAAAATIAAAFAAVSAAAIGAGKALVDMTKEGAAFADNILTESTVTGIATDKLQEYQYAAELVDVSTETLTKSMAKNIKSMSTAASGTGATAEAYKKLGISVTDANGQLRDSDTVYWELIDALGKVENETERDAMAMQVLGKSAQELNPLIKAGGQRMQELGKEAHEAGYVMSDEMLARYGEFDDQLQYLSVGATAAKNALGTVLLPVLTDLAGEGVDLLGEFSRGIIAADGDISKMGEVISSVLPKALDAVMEYVPVILDVIGAILTSIGQAIVDNLPQIVEATVSIVLSILDGLVKALPKIADGALLFITTLVKGIIDNLPAVLKVAIEVVVTLVEGIAKALPELIPAAVSCVVTLVQELINNLPMILDAALQLIQGLADGILQALPVLIAALPNIIIGIIDFLLGAIPQIIDAAISLLNAIIDAIPVVVAALIEALPTIIDSIINGLLRAIPLLLEAAVKLLMTIIDAIPVIIELLLKELPNIITAIITELLDHLPELIEMSIMLLGALIAAIPTIIAMLVKELPKIIFTIIDAIVANMENLLKISVSFFGNFIAAIPQVLPDCKKAVEELLHKLLEWVKDGSKDIKQAGIDFVKGLWEGIDDTTSWIIDKIKEFGDKILGGIKSFFGIHSPSTVFRDVVGKNLVLGLAEGIEDYGIESVNAVTDMGKDIDNAMVGIANDMQKSLPTEFDLGMNANIGSVMEGSYPMSDSGFNGSVVGFSLEGFVSSIVSGIREAFDGITGGDLVIPVYVGGTMLDEVIITAQQRANLRSGGR